jgi:hypothetical protein
MAVIIKPRLNAKEIATMMQLKKERIYAAIISRLQFVGEQFVENARNTDTYKDRTGNLRSSIGYVVYRDGQAVSADFPGTTGEGVAKAKALADEVAANHPQGFVLIGVAGMQYAASVESKGYDVITGSSDIAVSDLKKAMSDLKGKIKRV